MATSLHDDELILDLLVTSLCSFQLCRVEGIYLVTSGWHHADGLSAAARAKLEGELSHLVNGDGEVHAPGVLWAFALAVRDPVELFGHVVVSNDSPLSAERLALLASVAQQAGLSLAKARVSERLRATTEDLAAANAALSRAAAEAKRSLEIHERLAEAAAGGAGQEGLARVLHEITGFPVAIEDRWGNLKAWAGGSAPEPYAKEPPATREQLMHRLQRYGRSLWDRGRHWALASPGPEAMGVVALIDSEQTAGPVDLMALEHCATVLSVELARLHSLAEAELRLRGNLVNDLIAGADAPSALARAGALGHDLARPHWVALLHDDARGGRDLATLQQAARVAARNIGMGVLVAERKDLVVLLADSQPDWSIFRRAVAEELGNGGCRLAVGGRSEHVSEIPRSYQEAQLGLALQQQVTRSDTVCFDNLGIYRILAGVQDMGILSRFIDEMLGPLLAYDEKKGLGLVHTLHRYLECGGNQDLAARTLMLHRSTLKYRLHRVATILGCDLASPEVRFDLLVATKAWLTLQLLEATGPTS